MLLFECLLFQGSVCFSVVGNGPETFDKLFKLDICVSLLLFFYISTMSKIPLDQGGYNLYPLVSLNDFKPRNLVY